jgi:hypothetical protein
VAGDGAAKEAEHIAWIKRVLLDETQLFLDQGKNITPPNTPT